MKISIFILLCFLFTSSFHLKNSYFKTEGYDSSFVSVSNVNFGGIKFNSIFMKRTGERIKAKYFVASINGNSVYQRYNNWATGKSIVAYVCCAYEDGSRNPFGLAIDNGEVVNNTLADKMDGLVIVYATGGITVSNIKDGNLKVKYGARDTIFNLNNDWDLEGFEDWAKSNSATVFQTHLLAYKNKITIDKNSSSTTSRERRFVVCCKDSSNKLFHAIINIETSSTLYDASFNVFNYFTKMKQMKDIVFIINCDSGFDDILKFYNADGTINGSIEGNADVSNAPNLLTWYFQ